MKQYKHILEAIDKGIQLALDDFEDNTSITSKPNIVKDDEYVKHRLEFDNLCQKMHLHLIEKDELDRIIELYYKYGFKDKMTSGGMLQGIVNRLRKLNTFVDLNWLDVSEVTDMSSLFQDADFRGDISKWDVSHVEIMENMFKHSTFSGDISEWDVSHVTNMAGMFFGSTFNSDISNWDVSNCDTFVYMFYRNKRFDQDITRWDIKHGAETHFMFLMAESMPYKNRPLKLQET